MECLEGIANVRDIFVTLHMLVSFPDPSHGKKGLDSGRITISELSPCEDPGVANQIRWLLLTCVDSNSEL